MHYIDIHCERLGDTADILKPLDFKPYDSYPHPSDPKLHRMEFEEKVYHENLSKRLEDNDISFTTVSS